MEDKEIIGLFFERDERAVDETMKKYGANVLAIEAGETFIVEEEKMINFANKNKMVVVAV